MAYFARNFHSPYSAPKITNPISANNALLVSISKLSSTRAMVSKGHFQACFVAFSVTRGVE